MVGIIVRHMLANILWVKKHSVPTEKEDLRVLSSPYMAHAKQDPCNRFKRWSNYKN